MDDTHEAFIQRMKDTDSVHWAAWVLSEMQNWLSKRHDCTGMLHLEVAEQRHKFAEAINIALAEIDGRAVLGICDGKESILMRCKPEEKDYILDQIGQRITEGARYILVNISDGTDLAIKEPLYIPGEHGRSP